jgi:hypothetical protein
MAASWLATYLDYCMLTEAGAAIAPQLGPGVPRPLARSGAAVARELFGRPLLRYITRRQLGQFINGTSEETYVTLTAYAPEETVSYLMAAWEVAIT